MPFEPITKTKQKQLARETAKKAFGIKYPSNYQVGQARKIVMQLVNENPKKYLQWHRKYIIPLSNTIIEDAAERLNPQQSLFEMEVI